MERSDIIVITSMPVSEALEKLIDEDSREYLEVITQDDEMTWLDIIGHQIGTQNETFNNYLETFNSFDDPLIYSVMIELVDNNIVVTVWDISQEED